MDQANENDLSPSPSRLVESLRDTGYSHQAAFADIVDNSIAAGASIVKIDIFDLNLYFVKINTNKLTNRKTAIHCHQLNGPRSSSLSDNP